MAAIVDTLRRRPLVYVGDVERPILDADDFHHLARSLRVATGDPIAVSDGAGRWRLARFGEQAEPDGPIMEATPPSHQLTVGFVPVKGARSEQVVQKLTELGIDRIVPLFSSRSVVRWDTARAAKNHERHLKVAREAGMQSRRVRLPEILPPCSLNDFVAAEGNVGMCEPGGEPIMGSRLQSVVVGPEGGFEPSEVALGTPLGLPGGVLRAETAAYVAAALLAAAREAKEAENTEF